MRRRRGGGVLWPRPPAAGSTRHQIDRRRAGRSRPADLEQLEARARQLYFDAGKTIRRAENHSVFLREAVGRGAVVVRGVERSTAMEVARVLDDTNPFARTTRIWCTRASPRLA